MRKLLLLRPEPGLSTSLRRAGALGLETIACPLFEIQPVRWNAPDASDYDALLLTSANAVRHAGPELQRLKSLPVIAVGAATASAAREHGLDVASVGSRGVDELLKTVPQSTRLLHLCGEHRALADPLRRVETKVVYRSAAIDQPDMPMLEGLVAVIHSPRAGARLAQLAASRSHTAIAAISRAAAGACGSGWEKVETASRPDDESLLALGAMLCQTLQP